jgi:hypothetical protein
MIAQRAGKIQSPRTAAPWLETGATAVELGSVASAVAPIPADMTGWFKYFPTLNTGVVRTSDIMATVTAYGSIATYPRESVVRGGSISALWFAGYGPTGFLGQFPLVIHASHQTIM